MAKKDEALAALSQFVRYRFFTSTYLTEGAWNSVVPACLNKIALAVSGSIILYSFWCFVYFMRRCTGTDFSYSTASFHRGFAYFCIALLFVLDCFCLRTLLSYQNPQTFIFNHIALIILVWMSHALLYLSIVLSQLLLDSAGWIPFWDTQKDSALLCVFLISEFLCIVLSVCLMAVFPSLGVFSLLFVLGFALKLICSLLACSTVAQTLHCPLSAKECTYESVLECKQTIISLKY